MNILWKKGGGHSVVFLGFLKDKKTGKTSITYWSSQAESNGFADVYTTPVDSVKSIRAVRLTRPENIFNFNIENKVDLKIPGDKISF
jgi:hypothetical protein